MKLADLLVDAWVAVPLEAASLESALSELLLRLHAQGLLDEERALRIAADMAQGRHGEVVRVNDQVVAAFGTVESLAGPRMGIGIAPANFTVPGDGTGPRGARGVVLVLTPGKTNNLRQQVLPVLRRVLREAGRTERLLAVGSAEELRQLGELVEAELERRWLVEDAMAPVKYRVYPDTPLSEVLDLMVRRGIRAVPVVGDRYEVLGILTVGDVLEHALRKGRPGEMEPGDGARARDLMSRTVLCVAEDQALVDAANMMVNRNVEQLPVVREGELVGFITRDSILKVLYGATESETEPDPSNESDT